MSCPANPPFPAGYDIGRDRQERDKLRRALVMARYMIKDKHEYQTLGEQRIIQAIDQAIDEALGDKEPEAP